MAYLTESSNILLNLVMFLKQVTTLIITILNAVMDNSLFTISLNLEVYMLKLGNSFKAVQVVIYVYAIYLIILKFVKKILDVYALQVDGDSNVDIQILITNFFKAMVISMSFTTIWGWILEIVLDFGEKLVQAVNVIDIGEQINMLQELDLGDVDVGSPTTVLIPVFLFLATIMWCILLKNGMEFWLVRLGVPLACCGLMDSDQGVFKQYMKIILKEILTILIRIFMLHISLTLLAIKGDVGESDNIGRILLAFSAIIVAFSTPKMLSELLIQQNGGSGARAMSNIYMGSMLLRGVI